MNMSHHLTTLLIILSALVAGCAEPETEPSEVEAGGGRKPAGEQRNPGIDIPGLPFAYTSIGNQEKESTPVKTTDWPRFRGPDGAGDSEEIGLPTKWSATENMVWKRSLPGPGASCPIVVGDRIYVTCYSGYGIPKSSPGDQKDLKRHLVCLDRKSGRILWDTKVTYDRGDHGYTGFMKLHGYASSTPVSDGKQIYAYFGNWGAYAFDRDGKQLWRFDCGGRTHGFGSGASPILHGELLIVNASVESQCLVALNKATGKEVWRAKNIRDAWNTPVIVKSSSRSELVVSTRDGVLGIDASSGRSLWKWVGTKGQSYVCPSLVLKNGVLYGMPSYHGPVAAIRPGGTGDVSRSHTVWTAPRFSTTVTSPVIADAHLFYAHDNGNTLACFDLKTGTEKKRVRFRPSSGTIYGSPLAADGKIFIVTREKGTFVFKATPELEQLACNRISGDDSIFNASPVAHNGQLLLRSDSALYCIGKSK